jgi:Zn finger protein HypA/HybF involved in hydrogenase expression
MDISIEEKSELLATLKWHEKAKLDEMAEIALTDGLNLGICRNCKKVTDTELDATSYLCPRCGQYSIISILVLLDRVPSNC